MYVIHHQELENFHGVLGDISYGRSTSRVRDFIIQAFVKGARCGNAHHCELEGSTAVFSKRRFRDRRRIVECMHLLWVRKRLVTSPPIHSRYLFHTPDGIVLLSVNWRGLEIIPCGSKRGCERVALRGHSTLTKEEQSSAAPRLAHSRFGLCSLQAIGSPPTRRRRQRFVHTTCE